jgi:hypothetical protein
MNFGREKNLMHPTQIGFIPGNRTADHILTLKTLHDKYVKQSENGKIYACFVDFKKAFVIPSDIKAYIPNYLKIK